MIADAEVVGTLCTGWVRTFDGRQVVVALEDEMVVARLAIPLYRPGPGDEVLLARQHHDAFVIGVLQIAGAAELFAPEGLRIRSVGALDLVSAQQTRISGPRVGIEASSLTVAARSVVARTGGCVNVFSFALAARGPKSAAPAKRRPAASFSAPRAPSGSMASPSISGRLRP
jgi:hypothetical protein